jgi:ribonuclease BN (tRNA processing enzyme)
MTGQRSAWTWARARSRASPADWNPRTWRAWSSAICTPTTSSTSSHSATTCATNSTRHAAWRVIGPAGLRGRLDGVTDEPDFAAGTLEIEDRGAGHVQVGPFDLESRRVTHTADSFATRVTLAAAADGPAIVYSGDCGRAADLAPLIGPGDMLLCEVAFGPGPIPVPDLHLDGAAVGRLAAETRVSQVLLTHLQMKRDPAATLAAARAGYGGQVSLVSDGDRIPITG